MEERFIEVIKSVNSDILESCSRNLIDDGLLDSLGVMMLVSKLEETYGVDFDPEDIMPENFVNINTIYGLVLKYMKSNIN